MQELSRTEAKRKLAFGRKRGEGFVRYGLAAMLLGCWCGSALGVSYRWASSNSRIYVTGPGTTTLSDIKRALPKVPLTQVAPAVWYLGADLQVENGAALILHGTRIGGDVNQLRLKSNNTQETNRVVGITADWGRIDIRSTSITSWDAAVQGPDTECWTYQRAYIRVRSSLDEDGVTAHESRMDVIDSDIGYLGYHEAERYGLVWKVNPPKTNNSYGPLTNLYNLVNVYGDIKNSHIHHLFFGVYTFGAYRMQLLNNEVDHNEWYGFDPHDDSDELRIEGNNVHHNGTHGIIASQRCNNLTVRNNDCWNNGGNGIMLHRHSDYTLVEGNNCFHNGDSGIAIFDSRYNTVRGNTCWYNYRGGIRLSVGSTANLVEGNEFAYGGYGLYLYRGGDAPSPGDDGRPKRNWLVNNQVHHNAGEGIMLVEADDNVFAGNEFQANYGPFWFISARRNVLSGNFIPEEVILRTQGGPSFASSTVVTNQPFVQIQLDAYSSTTFLDGLGRVYDPTQSGVFTMASPSRTELTLTTAQIVKNSAVWTRNLQAVPDAGTALITIAIWNLSGDLMKSWLIQAGSSTRTMSYRVGDLAPNSSYNVFKNGVPTRFTSDDAGFISFQDQAVMTGLVQFDVRPYGR